ncbi:NHS-like protein 3 isoform X2 [Trachinotus anak]|uniref:NHS-like protein 3 isoform X2 n=1 Tax=Trachinotus anak TaxID=443729 RepID=UPI0039F172F9
MSRRRSTGDLVPRDITEILAREARAQRGQRKPGSSLGQAFSWLKGSRKKKSIGNGLNRTGAGVTDAKLGLQNHDPAKAGPKGNEDQKRLAVHYTTSQHHQENVFIEGSRPQYLEDLHTEAQEGLKILQQEEHKNGVNFPDDESIASSETLCPEQDISSKDRGGYPESISTTGNTDTTVTSSVSTRPVLTRQGSTFKPLNPVKRLDKSKKRSRRTTIMGIPNQVQKELALHRSSTFQPLVSTQLPHHNGQVTDSQSGVVIIPTVDGGTPVANKEGARVHLSELEASKDEQLLRKHLQAMYQDEQPLNHQVFGSHLCPTSTLRPKSVAVPGMTTSSSFCPSAMFSFLQEPQGPVMSVSPQATYLSTIIPNAVLPASIDVIEIDRSSRTRGSSVNHGSSVRTVSKGSLASGDSSVSPLLSRRSDGDGSQMETSCNDSTPMPPSTSGSNWSESQSSKTIISNSSPVSSKGSTHSGKSHRVGLNGQESQQEHSGGDQDLVSVRISVSGIRSPNSKSENFVADQGFESGSVTAGEDAKNKRNFTRSLSVMKTKQPPAPPQRTNSLHSNKIRNNSRILVESKDLNDSVSGEIETGTKNTAAKDEIKLATGDTSKIPTPVSNSTGSGSPDVSSSPMQTSSKDAGGPSEPQSESSSSSPQKTPSEGGKFERTMSPSSGYSSQSGTPTHSPKGISPTSPEKQKKKPVKPERSVSRASSSAASPASSLTSLSSGTSEPVNPDVSTCCPSLHPHGTPTTVTPNEFTPNNNSSTLRVEIRELLNIPPPPKVKAPCPPPPETWVHNRRTFELLCGPNVCPDVSKHTQNPSQIQDSTVKQAGTQTKAREEVQVLDERQTTTVKPVLELSESKTKPKTLLATDPEGVHKEPENRECPDTETKEVEASAEVQRQEQSSSPVVKSPTNQKTTPKKDPPPVMKKPITVLHREELMSTEQSVEIQQKDLSSSATTEVHIVVENHTTASQSGVMVLVDKSENEPDRQEVPSMQTLSVEVPKMNKFSPPPTPPPAYHPTPPPSRKTPPSSVSMPPDELQKVQEEIHFVEPCWPPPPPPLEGDSVFDGGDEVDFPPPPPPFVTDSVPDVVDSCVKQLDVLNEHTVAAQEVGETIKASAEAVTSVQEQNVDLPNAVPQLVVSDNKPEVDVDVSKTNTAEEISCRPVQHVSSLSDNVPSPPVEAPPLPPITRGEDPVSVSALVPSSSLRRDSMKIEDQSSPVPPVSAQTPITIPVAPPLPAENLTHGVNFRRQPSVSNRDTRSKELLSRHKSAPIPKEDANIPLVTPSLLQMVRLRSVNMTEDQMKASSEDKPTNEGAPVQENCPVSIPGPQNIPQKPIRKSLSLKSPPQTLKTTSVTLNTPSMRLQEAIRMKTAAMSSRDGLPSRLGVRSPTYVGISEPGAPSLKSTEGCDMHKSPASTASFIFSRSTKKVVIETAAASSPEAQASLKQNLAAELMHMSDQSRAVTFSNGGLKCDKVPPPVAKKPAHSNISPSQHHPACSGKMEFSVEGNGAIEEIQHTSGITPPETTTTRVTADTIETLF